MKIKISKNQWETIGKKNGWLKKAQNEGESLDFKFIEERAKEMFPDFDDVSIQNLIDNALKDNPKTTDEAINLLEKLRDNINSRYL